MLLQEWDVKVAKLKLEASVHPNLDHYERVCQFRAKREAYEKLSKPGQKPLFMYLANLTAMSERRYPENQEKPKETE